MTRDPDVLLYGFYATVFLAMLVLCHGLAQLRAARRQAAETRLRRMGESVKQEAANGGGGGLRRVRPLTSQDVGPWGWIAGPLARLVQQAGLSWRLRGIVYSGAGLGAACVVMLAAILGASGTDSWPWTAMVILLPLGIAAGAALPLLVLGHLRDRRLRRFEARLPEALDSMVRALRAGHPVSSAMAMVRTDLAGPVATEFGRAVDEMTYGLELRQALGNMALRVEHPDLRFVVASISLQHETGGNLADVLQGLADLMRARLRMARKVRAHTAEARLSARFLAVMPLIFVALVVSANPQVYGEMAKDALFLPVLAAAGALQVFGILVMRRMARFKL